MAIKNHTTERKKVQSKDWHRHGQFTSLARKPSHTWFRNSHAAGRLRCHGVSRRTESYVDPVSWTLQQGSTV